MIPSNSELQNLPKNELVQLRAALQNTTSEIDKVSLSDYSVISIETFSMDIKCQRFKIFIYELGQFVKTTVKSLNIADVQFNFLLFLDFVLRPRSKQQQITTINKQRPKIKPVFSVKQKYPFKQKWSFKQKWAFQIII